MAKRQTSHPLMGYFQEYEIKRNNKNKKNL